VSELGRKLIRSGYAADQVESVLQELVGENLLDDGRFAEVYVRSHASRGAGPVRIAHGLAEHGLRGSDAEVALAPFDDRWVRLAALARSKRFGNSTPVDIKDRARQSRFLHYRGFTAEQIRRALSIEDEHADCGDVE